MSSDKIYIVFVSVNRVARPTKKTKYEPMFIATSLRRAWLEADRWRGYGYASQVHSLLTNYGVGICSQGLYGFEERRVGTKKPVTDAVPREYQTAALKAVKDSKGKVELRPARSSGSYSEVPGGGSEHDEIIREITGEEQVGNLH